MLAIVGAAGLAGPAQAAVPVFAAPQTLAADGIGPSVAIGPAGDAVVAWAGRTSGVFVARRGVLGGSFSAPERVGDDIANGVRISRNLQGALALAWTGRPDHYTAPSLRVAVAPLGARFDAPETVPLPAARGVSGSTQASPGDVNVPAVLLGADGSVTAAVGDVENRVLAAVRPLGGRFGEAQVLGTNARSVPVVAADGLGSIALLWLATPDGAPSDPRRVVLAAERRLGAAFGAPHTISDPAFGAGAPRVAANARGDMLATWAVFDTSVDGGVLFPVGADVSDRTFGGPWSKPHSVTAPARPFFEQMAPALNDFGAGVVAASAPWGQADAVFRPAGRAFGPQVQTLVPSGVASGSPNDAVGIDALGGTVHAISTGRPDAGRISAVVRAATGWTEVTSVSDAVEPTGVPALATDRFGNGLIAWSGGGMIKAATYSAAAPFVSRLRVGRREFRFRSSEPAIVTLSIRRSDRRKATQTTLAGPTANRIRFSNRMRHLLRRRGRYTVTVQTRDAGPSTGRLKIKIRRR